MSLPTHMDTAVVQRKRPSDNAESSKSKSLNNDPAQPGDKVKTKTNPKQRTRRKNNEGPDDSTKRRCISTACIACRKRKSKCDGDLPECAACSKIYGTECIYDPNSDHRRKGVYKYDSNDVTPGDSTLQTLIQAILNFPEHEVPSLIQEIRTCESLDAVAEKITGTELGRDDSEDGDDLSPQSDSSTPQRSAFETQLSSKMGDLRLDDGTVRHVGGTSNLIYLAQDDSTTGNNDEYLQQENPITSWTSVIDDPQLVIHLLHLYFSWHYPYFTTLSKKLFLRDFLYGKPPAHTRRKTSHCTPLLVNAILALGCHFTSHPGARENPADSATAGNHFFREAKRLIMEDDEHEKPALATVQALALMSVREAGCGREARGWIYSGMSFRMAYDMGLNLDPNNLTSNKHASVDESEDDARRITFWGCYLFDKCWSNYLGRLPQLPTSIVTASKYEVFPEEEDEQWSLYNDSGFTQTHAQPMRTREVALQITQLCEISNDLMLYFYNPTETDRARGKAAEMRKLSDIHTRLEAWRRELPKEMEPREGCLPSVLVMHMFCQLLFIHLFRPFLKYTQANSPLPPTVSPRKLCTQAASMISKLMRLYKRSHGLRQICNIAVYNLHSACTIHLLNLSDKNAKRDIIHGVKHLEEISESWLCARRTLLILGVLARKWDVDLPEEAATVLARTESNFGPLEGSGNSSASRKESFELPSGAIQSALSEARPNIPAASTTGWNLENDLMSQSHPYSDHTHGGPTFPNNGNPAMPSHNTANYLNQQYQSGSNIPGVLPNPNARSEGAASQGESPTGLFGGVEQLIRDSQDWAYRDQAQLATAFGSWNSMDVDYANWSSSVSNTTSLPGPVSANSSRGSFANELPMNHHSGTYDLNVINLTGGLGSGPWQTGTNTFDHSVTMHDDDGWDRLRMYNGVQTTRG